MEDGAAAVAPRAGSSARWTPALLALVAAAIAAGLVLRVWIARSSLGKLGTDEATWGLMARRVLHGEVSAFFWGQAYGGTQEVFPVAALFAVFGTHVVLMRIVPMALGVVAALVVWWAGRRTDGMLPGLVAALLVWIWPVYAVYKLEIWSGFYGVGLLYSALAIALTLRLDERPARATAAVAGLVLGLAFWGSIQTVAVIGPCLAWLTLRRPRVWRLAPYAVPGLIVGALPWLVSNLRHDWWSLSPRGGAGSYASRLHGYVSGTLPMMLGLRVPLSAHWLLGTAVSGAVYVAAWGALLVHAWRSRRTRRSLAPFVILAFPFLYAADALTVNTSEPRYVFVLLPALALVLGGLARTTTRAALVLAAAAGLSLAGLASWLHWRDAPARAVAYNPGEVDVGPVIAALRRRRIDRAFSDYSLAYRITFVTRERIVVSEADLGSLAVRGGRVLPAPPAGYTTHHHPAYDRQVRAAPRFAYVFVRGEPDERRDVRLLEAHGFRREQVGSLLVLTSPASRARR